MKVSHKVVLSASIVVALAFAVYSWLQYSNLKDALYEKTTTSTQETSKSLALQLNNWLNGKVALINTVSQTIDADFSPKRIQSTFDTPIYKDEFLILLVVWPQMANELPMILAGTHQAGMRVNALGIR